MDVIRFHQPCELCRLPEPHGSCFRVNAQTRQALLTQFIRKLQRFTKPSRVPGSAAVRNQHEKGIQVRSPIEGLPHQVARNTQAFRQWGSPARRQVPQLLKGKESTSCRLQQDICGLVPKCD